MNLGTRFVGIEVLKERGDKRVGAIRIYYIKSYQHDCPDVS